MAELTEIVCDANLPDIITHFYPDAHRFGRWYADWRGDKKPSLSVYHKGNKWRWKDFATGEGGDAWDFLTQIVGMDTREARSYLNAGTVTRRPKTHEKSHKPEPQPYAGPSAWTHHKLRKGQQTLRRSGMPRTLGGRGISRSQAVTLGLGRLNQDTLIPLATPQGKLITVKRRHGKGESRYTYLDRGAGAPCWYSPNYLEAGNVIVCEGELNAIAVYCATGRATVGMAGANAKLPELEAVNVFILSDNDKAGKDARDIWGMAACAQGIDTYVLGGFGHGGDACDYAGAHGQDALRRLIDRQMERASRYNAKPSKATIRVARAQAEGINNHLRAAIAAGVTPQRVSSVWAKASTLSAPKATPPYRGFRYLLAHGSLKLPRNDLLNDPQIIIALSACLENGQIRSRDLIDLLGVGLSRCSQILKVAWGSKLFVRERSHDIGGGFIYRVAPGFLETLQAIADKAREGVRQRVGGWLTRMEQQMQRLVSLMENPMRLGSWLRKRYPGRLAKGSMAAIAQGADSLHQECERKRAWIDDLRRPKRFRTGQSWRWEVRYVS